MTFPPRTYHMAGKPIVGLEIGERANTIGSPNAEITIPIVRNTASSWQGFDGPIPVELYRLESNMGIGASM